MRKPTTPDRRFPYASTTDNELLSVLAEMLDRNETISARAAIRHMSTAKSVTDITRDEWRRSVLTDYQTEQTRLRAMSSRWGGTSKADLTLRAELDHSKLNDLQKENDIMRAGLVAAIRAVGEHGAFRPWRKFFDEYEETFAVLKAKGVPVEAEVVQLPAAGLLRRKQGRG